MAVALVALSAVPLAAGALRLLYLSGGPDLLPDDDRFPGFPVALVLHIVGAAVFALVGALQFVPRLRHQSGWHRRAGRVVSAAGLAVAASALWLTLFYDTQPGTGDLLRVLRLLFAPAMTVSLLLGVRAIRRHDVTAHRAWMIRTYAIGLAAGTQVLTGAAPGALHSTGELQMDLAMGAAWAINLAVAEWAIGRHARDRRRSRGTTAPRHAGAAPA